MQIKELLISDKYDHFDYGMGEVECFLEKVKVIKRKENISFKRANGEKIRESYRTNGLHVVKIFELEELL